MGKRNQVAVTTWRPLSRQEANRLQECEARIRKALDDMVIILSGWILLGLLLYVAGILK